MHGLSMPSFASSRQIQHASSSGVSRTGTRVRAISQRRARIRGRSVNAFTEKRKDASVVDAEGAEGGLGRPGVSRGLSLRFRLAARPTRRGYDVPPGSATRASDLVRRGSVPDTIAPYRLAWKGARSNGVRANSRCDSGRRASPGSARVRRARRGVGHASVRVDAGDTRETRERRRAGREGRARVWVW